MLTGHLGPNSMHSAVIPGRPSIDTYPADGNSLFLFEFTVTRVSSAFAFLKYLTLPLGSNHYCRCDLTALTLPTGLNS